MPYYRPTFEEEEFLPMGFTEVRKDFSLPVLWCVSLFQPVWATDRWYGMGDCMFLGASAVK